MPAVPSPPPFERAVADHGPLVLRVLSGLLGRQDAEDCWQEVFVAALRAWPRLRPDSDVRAWLVTIAHRKAVDAVRARARTDRPSDPLPRPRCEVVVAGPQPREDALLAAVRALPDRQRTAVAWHYLADQPYAVVAQLTGTSEAAARRSAADGVRALRLALGTSTSTSFDRSAP